MRRRAAPPFSPIRQLVPLPVRRLFWPGSLPVAIAQVQPSRDRPFFEAIYGLYRPLCGARDFRQRKPIPAGY